MCRPTVGGWSQYSIYIYLSTDFSSIGILRASLPPWLLPRRLNALSDAMSINPTIAPLEWALRAILASALVIHSIIDINDPSIGAKSRVLQVEDSIPRWLLPAVGILRALSHYSPKSPIFCWEG